MSVSAPPVAQPPAAVQNAAGQPQDAISGLLVAVASGVALPASALAAIALQLGVDANLLALILHTLGEVPAVVRSATIPERVALGENLARRVGFAVNASRPGLSANQLEQRTRAHLQATKSRQESARQVGVAMRRHDSLVLGWRAVLDGKTTEGCRAAHGGNFHVRRPPIVEGSPAYPGWPHGGTCRCRPVKPYRFGRMLS